MAREVLLRFKTRNYERARKVAEAIRKRTEQTLKKTKALKEELRQSLSSAQEAAGLKARGAALGKRGAKASQRDLQDLQRKAFEKVLGPAGRARELGTLFGTGLFGAGPITKALPSLIGGVGQLVPGLGPLASLISPLVERGLSKLEEKVERRLAEFEKRLEVRREEDRFRTSYSRRISEDPVFRFQEAKKALEETLALEKKLGRRIHGHASLVEDFGL